MHYVSTRKGPLGARRSQWLGSTFLVASWLSACGAAGAQDTPPPNSSPAPATSAPSDALPPTTSPPSTTTPQSPATPTPPAASNPKLPAGAVGVLAINGSAAQGGFMMRGFAGDAINHLYNGINIGIQDLTGRTQDTFSFDRIEFLKGASALA
jgi:iron complex outermembrane recepter protein